MPAIEDLIQAGTVAVEEVRASVGYDDSGDAPDDDVWRAYVDALESKVSEQAMALRIANGVPRVR